MIYSKFRYEKKRNKTISYLVDNRISGRSDPVGWSLGSRGLVARIPWAVARIPWVGRSDLVGWSLGSRGLVARIPWKIDQKKAPIGAFLQDIFAGSLLYLLLDTPDFFHQF